MRHDVRVDVQEQQRERRLGKDRQVGLYPVDVVEGSASGSASRELEA